MNKMPDDRTNKKMKESGDSSVEYVNCISSRETEERRRMGNDWISRLSVVSFHPHFHHHHLLQAEEDGF
jgi:hypothetical protein